VSGTGDLPASRRGRPPLPVCPRWTSEAAVNAPGAVHCTTNRGAGCTRNVSRTYATRVPDGAGSGRWSVPRVVSTGHPPADHRPGGTGGPTGLAGAAGRRRERGGGRGAAGDRAGPGGVRPRPRPARPEHCLGPGGTHRRGADRRGLDLVRVPPTRSPPGRPPPSTPAEGHRRRDGTKVAPRGRGRFLRSGAGLSRTGRAGSGAGSFPGECAGRPGVLE
jgi:hypothetical protein